MHFATAIGFTHLVFDDSLITICLALIRQPELNAHFVPELQS